MRLKPYSMRHGGSSHAREVLGLELAVVKKKGRWASDRNVARYEKEGRLQNLLKKASANMLDYGKTVKQHLDAFILGDWSPAPIAPRKAAVARLKVPKLK